MEGRLSCCTITYSMKRTARTYYRNVDYAHAVTFSGVFAHVFTQK